MPESTSKGSRPNVIVFVHADDWEGLYINGVLATEGVQLTPRDVLASFGLDCETRAVNEDWIREERTLPMYLSDVVLDCTELPEAV